MGKKRNRGRNFGHLNGVKTVKKIVEASIKFKIPINRTAFENYKVLPYYDSLIGKLIVHAENRDLAISRMQRALNEFIIEGIDTTLELHKEVITSKDFKANNYDIKWLEKYLARN